MSKSMKLLALVVLIALAGGVQGQYLEFIENKGQWDEKIRFKGEIAGGGSLFLQKNGYKVLLHNKEDMDRFGEMAHGHPQKDLSTARRRDDHDQKEDLIIRSHAYEVSFIGASPDPEIIPEKVQMGVSNYLYGNDPSKWVSNARTFLAVTYKNIYPNVDVRYYTDNGRLKYDIIARPGADISKIAMRFDGVDKVSLDKGNLVVKTSVDEVRELKPYTYEISRNRKKELQSSFDLKGNILRFKVNDRDHNAILVIDPVLIFSTFSGSKADNWGFTATYDGEGNFYGGGIVFADGFPVSVGAFQTNFGGGPSEYNTGGHDISIIKLSPFGDKRLYATYIGGTGNEQPTSMFVDPAGNVVITGKTNSPNFPTTLPTYGPGGNYDLFIIKLNAAGSGMVASRKFGGTGIEAINIDPKAIGKTQATSRNYGDDSRSEVILDGAGNIYVASCTQSQDLLTTLNAPQKANGGGTKKQDGLIIKTSPDLSNVLLCTYFGGSGDDAAFVLALHPFTNDLYVAGGTVSPNLPGDKTNTINPNFRGGDCDGFVTIINNTTGQVLKTSYFGTNAGANGAADIIYGIQFDKFGYPYITGTTTGQWPVINAPFSQANGKQFISKLQPDLSAFVYSTIFGSGTSALPNISITAMLVDRCENVYVSGWGGDILPSFPNAGTNGMSLVNPVLKPNGTDGKDFYFFVLERNATSQLYGDFFGQQGGQTSDHVDGGTSRFDREGVIYQAICGNCGTPPKPTLFTTSGSWSPSNQAVTNARCNLAMIKVAFNLAGVGTAVKSSINGITKKSGCVPLTVDFEDTLNLGKRFRWNFGDGSPETETTVPKIQHTYNQVGDYQVRLIAIDSSTCNISDTSYITIRARNNEANVSYTVNKLLPCEALNYQFTNTSTPAPGVPFQPNSFRWDFGDGNTSTAANPTHSYAAPGTYITRLILLDTNYCNAPDSAVITLRIAANVKAQFETPPFGCVPYNAPFTNTSLGGTQFRWDFGDGTSSTQESPTHLYNVPGTYTIRMIAEDTSTCNKIDSASFTITVSPNPTAAFTFTPNPPQENTPVEFINQSIGGTLYKWYFGDGDSTITTRIDTTVRHVYNENQVFNACLYTFNQFGCVDTACLPLEAKVAALFDVPTAFTPNGDGVNDKIYIRAYGVRSFTWRIYNRWGTLVYVSTNFKDGWDGTYKGVMQPQEVYTYVADIVLADGKNYRKTGDITLLR